MQNVIRKQQVRANCDTAGAPQECAPFDVARALKPGRLEAPTAGHWEIERDVIRGRTFDRTARFMPDGLSQVSRLEFLGERERTLLSQIQGRTYANMFRLIERFVGTNMLEISRAYLLADAAELESLVRYTQDELKHQALFARIEMMMAGAMAKGYRFEAGANDFSWLVLGRSRWAVLALTCMMEHATQAHYLESIAADPAVSPLYRDVFFFHWQDEKEHVAASEREWRTEDERLTPAERNQAVDELIELLRMMNMLLQRQAAADAAYFFETARSSLTPSQAEQVRAAVLRAYRWQYILAGVQHERYADVLAELASDSQCARIKAAVRPFADCSSAPGRHGPTPDTCTRTHDESLTA